LLALYPMDARPGKRFEDAVSVREQKVQGFFFSIIPGRLVVRRSNEFTVSPGSKWSRV